ncbi:transcription termination factor 2, partial [Histoplasma capsulatum]
PKLLKGRRRQVQALVLPDPQGRPREPPSILACY